MIEQRLTLSQTSLRGANGSRECAPDDRLPDEAIQGNTRGPGLLRRKMLLAMTVRHTLSFSRHIAPEVCQFVRASREGACDPRRRGRSRPSQKEGAGNAGCPMHPWFGQKMPGSCHRFTGLNRHSLRDGFTVSFVLSPATGRFCHRHPWEALASQELDASNGASGPHDFAVRFNAVRPHAKST
jgi:hypothetical protein